MSADQSKPSIPPKATALPTPQADAADRCLKCNAHTPGARYLFWVAKRQTLSPHIVHEEKAFICDRCAGAWVRFSPLIVLLLWVPVLALITLFVGYGVVRSWTRGFPVGGALRLMLLLGLLFLIVVLIRLAWGQLHAIRARLFHRLLYSSSVARLAIQLRKKELLRSLHLSESNALFLTEDHALLRSEERRV